MKTVVFATCQAQPDLTESDVLAANALKARGVEVIAAPWNGDFAPFEKADLVVVRSTWDYAAAPDNFRDWISRVDVATKLSNPAALIYANISKRYLRRLEMNGVPIVKTAYAAPNAGDIGAAMTGLGLDEAVVKPVIGAGASGLSIIRKDDPSGLEAAAANLGGLSAMVQPVLHEISEVGETSLIYLGGVYSHAVRKLPKKGDLRVQEEHGGRTEVVEPAPSAIALGLKILEGLPQKPTYLRLDAILSPTDQRKHQSAQINGGGLDEPMQLMEVELIEPELFFTHAPDATDRFAVALIEKLS